MRSVLLTAFGAAVLLHGRSAAAWACPDTRAAILESPSRAPAPRNVRLLVRFARKPSALDLREITLRSARGKVVPMHAIVLPEQPPRAAPPGVQPVLMQLVPDANLEPATRYEISWKMSERALREWPNPPNNGHVATIGGFTTSSRIDTAPPVLPGEVKSAFVDRGWVWHSYKGGARTRLRAWPQALLRIDTLSDDQTPSGELYYLAWRVGAERSAFLLRRRTNHFTRVLEIGDGEPPYECQAGHQFPFPNSMKRYLMAVVAIDLAGNVSLPHYFMLDRRQRLWKVPNGFH